MTKRKILVCGASGFIGRNLFEYYSKFFHSIFETYGTYLKNKPNILRPNLFQCDLRDRNQAILATKYMDIVINCAAMTDGIGAVDANPTGYIADNIRINTNLIETAHINRVEHFVFLSCTVMYPSSMRPLKEHEHDLNNVHIKYYMGARMKVFSEDLCQFYAGLGDTKYTAVRHTNVYGPYDKFDLKHSHVLPATITKVMKAKDRIIVWGSGTESRDFLYISDLIQFIDRAIGEQENNFEIFNVGYGKTFSVNKLVRKIISCSSKKIEVVHDLEKPTIETHMNVNVEKAKQLLNWKAQISLNEGLNKTIKWYRQNHNSQ